MTKLTLVDIDNLQNESSAVATVNNNSNRIELALDNTLSRDGSVPNAMSAPLDMNSNRIINLPAALTMNEPVRLQEFINTVNGGTVTISPAPIPFVVGTENLDFTPVGNPIASKASWYVSGETQYNRTREFESIFSLVNSKGSLPLTGISKANPGVVTAVGHGFATGFLVTLHNVGGMTQVNDQAFIITVTDVDHFSLGVDTTGYTTYTSGGIVAGPTVTGSADKVTIYAENIVKAPSGSKPGGGQAWAINTVSIWEAGAPKTSGHGMEIDVNVNNFDYDTLNPSVFGLSITGAGSHRASAGINISAAVNEMWNYGLIFTLNPVKHYSIYDIISNANVTTLKIEGEKLYGIDTNNCFFHGGAIRVGNDSAIVSRNAAGDTDINILYLDQFNVCQLGGSAPVNIIGNGGLTGFNLRATNWLQMGTFLVSTLPTAGVPGTLIYVSNEAGGATLAFADGSNWRRVQDRAIVS